jgi:hypothetical protein
MNLELAFNSSIPGAGHYLYLTHANEVRAAADVFRRDLTDAS